MGVTYDFSGRVALVTGGGKGIGKATALAFGRTGATVVLCARTLADVEAVANTIRAAGGKATAIRCDVASEPDVVSLVAKTLEAHGTIDVLVNNAGIGGGKAALVDTPMRDFDAVIAVNLRGTALCSKYVVPHMTARKRGAIVNLSSTWGRTAGTGKMAYVASKWAVIGMTQALALEVAKDGIRVNCVVPGYTMTEMLRKSREELAAREGITFEQAIADAAAFSPQNRVVSAEEVADVILWLASEAAVSLHGQTVNANAALYMN